ncbi:curli assembly protein CsgF [Endozoicomonas arenosclerae]|uniref:curli assembly protein CsgF n=1 Tax=Endozoicomonas arenosclerae TaxID=1633495 RepID=UPI0009A18053|nr:curli assembly protein CsgF [Endozoicomonas arenosclerae]
MKPVFLTASLFFSATLFTTTQSLASELVYSPVNPSFGGNPINGTYLISNAQSQNKHTSGSSSSSQRSSLDRFNDSLQSRLLSQLLADIGQGGQNSGLLSTDDFIVQIDQGGDGLNIVTTDKNTGESTTITVDGLIAD